MRVHVPEARNEELPRAVHSHHFAWDGDSPTNVRDQTSLGHDCHGSLSCAARHINERHIGNGDGAVSRERNARLLACHLSRGSVPAAHHEKAENRQDVQAPIGYRAIHRLSLVPAVGSSPHRVAGPSIYWLSSRPNASGLEGSTLKSARLFAGGDSVVRREVRARMSELRKTGVGGF